MGGAKRPFERLRHSRSPVLRSALRLLIALGAGALGPVATAVPASAQSFTGSNVCTWNASASSDLSVASNWTATQGSCGTGSTAGTASLGGAELVFPSTPPRSGAVVVDQSESPDDLVFGGTYALSGNGTLAVSGTSDGGVAVDVTSGAPTISAPIQLAATQSWATAAGASLGADGAVSSTATSGLTVSGDVTVGGALSVTGNLTIASTGTLDASSDSDLISVAENWDVEAGGPSPPPAAPASRSTGPAPRTSRARTAPR